MKNYLKPQRNEPPDTKANNGKRGTQIYDKRCDMKWSISMLAHAFPKHVEGTESWKVLCFCVVPMGQETQCCFLIHFILTGQNCYILEVNAKIVGIRNGLLICHAFAGEGNSLMGKQRLSVACVLYTLSICAYIKIHAHT